MVTVDIKSVQQMLPKKKLLLDIQNVFPKNLESFVIHRYSIKMCFFFQTYILEKYVKDKLTI